jgi:hypothetical protein
MTLQEFLLRSPSRGDLQRRRYGWPSPGHWHHPPKLTASGRWNSWSPLTLGIPFVFLISCFLFIALTERRGFLIVVLPICLFGLMPVLIATATRRQMGSGLRANRGDLALRDDSKESVLLVEVVVHVSGHQASVDRGVVGFTENALFFSGHSFSFLLGAQDVLTLPGMWVHGPHSALGVRHPTEVIVITFSALETKEGLWRESATFLRTALQSFELYEPTTLFREYPPLEPWAPPGEP